MSIWNLLPAGLVARAKAILAFVGSAAFVVVHYVPALAHNGVVTWIIAALTALGVYAVPNRNAKTRA